MKLQKNAKCIVTDSGGIQSEACAFGVPCLTMRDNTERPHTLIENGGTNRLVGGSPESLNKEVENAISKRWIAKMDDKKSGELIVEQIMQEC
jgi:UDP-N-acetylglucosamine 2-epimerase (non-hydrolysing)